MAHLVSHLPRKAKRVHILKAVMFGKARCKICGDSVRFALKHLKEKHPDIYESQITKMKMPKIMEKFFD